MFHRPRKKNVMQIYVNIISKQHLLLQLPKPSNVFDLNPIYYHLQMVEKASSKFRVYRFLIFNEIYRLKR